VHYAVGFAAGVGKQMANNGAGRDILPPSNGAEQDGANFLKNDLGPTIAIAAAFEGEGAAGPKAALPDGALVVRGGSSTGANSADGIAAGTSTHPSGVTGFSVESAPGKSVEQLAGESPSTSKYGQVGCCTVGEIRKAGGEVTPTAGQSPNHATVSGLSPAAASNLLTPTIPNPAKAKEPEQ
jgi:hypothetical protein